MYSILLVFIFIHIYLCIELENYTIIIISSLTRVLVSDVIVANEYYNRDCTFLNIFKAEIYLILQTLRVPVTGI